MSRSRTPERKSARDPQRGAALLTAMMIVVLVVTLTSAMVWQQWRAVQVEESERSRAQSEWILTGALDWARLILREDARTAGSDNLTEPWAVPLAEARLSTFLAADRDNTEDGPEAFLSGLITDAQSRYNLRNLNDEDKVPIAEQKTLLKLFDFIGVAPEVGTRLIASLRAAKVETGTSSSNATRLLMPESVSELSWFGLDAETLRRIQPYVALLPDRSPVNVNTASREVIAAAIDGLDLAGAERIVQQRQRAPFKTLKEVQDLLPDSFPPLTDTQVDVKSKYFEVRGRLRLADRVLEERSLVERQGLQVIPLQRKRVNSRDEPGP